VSAWKGRLRGDDDGLPGESRLQAHQIALVTAASVQEDDQRRAVLRAFGNVEIKLEHRSLLSLVLETFHLPLREWRQRGRDLFAAGFEPGRQTQGFAQMRRVLVDRESGRIGRDLVEQTVVGPEVDALEVLAVEDRRHLEIL